MKLFDNYIILNKSKSNNSLYNTLNKILCIITLVGLFCAIFLINSSFSTIVIRIVSVVFYPFSVMIPKFFSKDILYNSIELSYLDLILILMIGVILSIFLNIIFYYLKHKYTSKNSNYITPYSDYTNNKNITIHDLKNLLFAVSGYMSIGEYDKASQKLNQICTIFHKEVSSESADTLQAIVIRLIESKKTYIDELNISFNYQISINENLNIDSLDLCSVIGNVFDNAIEACEKLNNKNNRFITFKIISYSKSIKILISNSSSSILDPGLKSNKQNKLSHGLGLKSIKSVVNRYSGSIYVQQISETFIIEINLNLYN